MRGTANVCVWVKRSFWYINEALNTAWPYVLSTVQTQLFFEHADTGMALALKLHWIVASTQTPSPVVFVWVRTFLQIVYLGDVSLYGFGDLWHFHDVSPPFRESCMYGFAFVQLLSVLIIFNSKMRPGICL